MMALDRLEDTRKRLPELAGAAAGVVADNPLQFATIVSGAYVVTRIMHRLAGPETLPGALMTAAASYAACRWILAEAQARGVLVFRQRDPVTGELITGAEFEARYAENPARLA